MTVEYITYGEYVFCTNRIAYWLLTHNNPNKPFKTRDLYGYENHAMTRQEVADTIMERGREVIFDNKAFIITEFVECAIYDNTDLSFLPAYVTCSDGKTKLYLDTYVDMCNRVSAYEVLHGRSPNIVYIKNKTDKLYPYITQQGGGKLGQTNGVRCGPHSLMQSIYRLTGIELSESTLASICGTTSAGTSHQGLETCLAWFNRKYGYNLKMKWMNKSDISWEQIQNEINNGAVFFHLLYRNQWGHYEVIKNVEDSLTILNSLGSYCNYPAYCGYIENRSKNTQQSYINGISQKSVCIITR